LAVKKENVGFMVIKDVILKDKFCDSVQIKFNTILKKMCWYEKDSRIYFVHTVQLKNHRFKFKSYH